MKVLFITNMLQTGGAEILMRDVLLEMASLGHDVAIYVFHTCKGKIEEELRAAAVPVIHGSGESIFFSHIFQLGRHLSKNNYDVVHSHLYPAQLRAVLASKLFCLNTPLITTEHSSYYFRREQFKSRMYDRVMYPLYNHVICISEAVREALFSLNYVNPSKLSVVYNGIKIDRFTANSAPLKSKQKGCVNLLAVGRLDTSKNYPLLLGAIRKVDGVILSIAGEGPLKDDLTALAKLHGVADRVHFLGNCSNIPKLMRRNDFFVQASSWEGFGIATVEAMASDLPVIVSRVPGLMNIVDDAGLQFEPDNEGQLVECINRMVESENLRETLRCKGRERAKLYRIEKTVDGYLQVYRNIAKQF